MRARAIGVVTFLLGASGPARADHEEWRVSVAGVLDAGRVSAAETSSVAPFAGGRLRLGYGLSNALEAAMVLGLATSQSMSFAGAEMQGHSGTLYANVLSGEASAELRAQAGLDVSPRFETTLPYVAFRAGFVLRALTGQELLNGRNQELLLPGAEVEVVPALGLRLGVEHRFSHRMSVGLGVSGTYAGDAYASCGLSLEASYLTY
jgi:hypothetical protein